MRKYFGILIVLCVLAGCTQPGLNTNQPLMGNADHTLAEYKDSVETWPQPLPEEDSYPVTPTGLSQDEYYDEGFGTSFVAFYWRCAWMGSYLDSFDSGDSSGQRDSLMRLEQWQSISWVQEHVVDDPDAGWEQAILQPARLGDPSTMRTFHQSC